MTIHMSALQFAREECANYAESRGSCLGLTAESLFPKPGEPRRARPLPRCRLAGNQRCAYFEAVVLPLADRGNARFLQAREDYFGSKALATGGAPKPRLCECGQPKAAGKQFCENCRKLHRKTSFRREKNRQRNVQLPVLQKSPKSSL